MFHRKSIPPRIHSSLITFELLLHLRWGTIAGQLILISLVSSFFHIDIPLILVGAIISFEAISNFIFQFLATPQKDIPESLLGSIMIVDIILLTILLFKTGGAMNPFTFLYFLHVVIGAILMTPMWSWSLSIFTILCYASFFITPDVLFNHFLPVRDTTSSVCVDISAMAEETGNQLHLHLQGMLVAFAITTLFTVYFISKIQKSLQNYNNALTQLEQEKVKGEKLVALATLAAGAAHELSTPLSTISVATGEMIHLCNKQNLDNAFLDDLFLIRNQVQACKEILDQLAMDAGEHRGEPLTSFSSEELIEEIKDSLSDSQLRTILFHNNAPQFILNGPIRSLTRSIKGLIKNGIDASPPGSSLDVSFNIEKDFFNITVQDQGIGMSPETLKRAKDPFFTTKEPGQGMGLGLYLANTLAERYGGGLDFQTKTGTGTRVTMKLDIAKIEESADEKHTVG